MSTMATIRSSCPKCGEVDMGPASITLKTNKGMREGKYWFRCPSCFSTVEKWADKKIIGLLSAAGVDVVQEEEPKDPRGNIPPNPALTLDDAIDFHAQLEDDDAIERFLRG